MQLTVNRAKWEARVESDIAKAERDRRMRLVLSKLGLKKVTYPMGIFGFGLAAESFNTNDDGGFLVGSLLLIAAVALRWAWRPAAPA